MSVYKKLFEAQGLLKHMEATARNQHGRYNYVKSEDMIAAATEVFQRVGVVLVPGEITQEPMSGTVCGKAGDKDQGGYVIKRTFYLVDPENDTCAGQHEFEASWPVFTQSGKPFDKGHAGALTGMLGYVIRDILLIPRAEKGGDFNSAHWAELEESKPKPVDKVSDEILAEIKSAATKDALQHLWQTLSDSDKKLYKEEFSHRKGELS